MNPDDLPDRRPISMMPMPGWRALCANTETWWSVPVVGSELTENIRTDHRGEVTEDIGEAYRSREWRIRVAVPDGLTVDLGDYYGDEVWMLLAPGEPDPTEDEVSERKQYVARMRTRREQMQAEAAERAEECRRLGLHPGVSDAVLAAVRGDYVEEDPEGGPPIIIPRDQVEASPPTGLGPNDAEPDA